MMVVSYDVYSVPELVRITEMANKLHKMLNAMVLHYLRNIRFYELPLLVPPQKHWL